MKMCHALARCGCEVELVALFPPRAESRGGCDPFAFYGQDPSFKLLRLRVPHLPGKTLILALRAAHRISKRPPDLVYARNIYAACLAARQNVPVIAELHSPPSDALGIAPNCLQRLTDTPSFLRAVAITDALREQLIQRYPTLDRKTLTLADAADPVAQDAVPAALPGRSGTLQIGYTGHFYHGKGVDLIVSLAERCPWATFHVAGGRQADLKRFAACFRKPGNLWVHGYLPYQEAERIRLACDVLLLPNQRVVKTRSIKSDIGPWTSPLKLFEYMAAGKAIVCSDLPVLREVLTHEYNALLCDPEDTDSWVAALVRLRDDLDMRIAIGRQAHTDFTLYHTWDTRARRILALLE